MQYDNWLLLLFLAAMSGITPETIQKRKEKDKKLRNMLTGVLRGKLNVVLGQHIKFA